MSNVWYYAEGEMARGPLTLPELTSILSQVSQPNGVLELPSGSRIPNQGCMNSPSCVFIRVACLTEPTVKDRMVPRYGLGIRQGSRHELAYFPAQN
jgi:hypothetical protein